MTQIIVDKCNLSNKLNILIDLINNVDKIGDMFYDMPPYYISIVSIFHKYDIG